MGIFENLWGILLADASSHAFGPALGLSVHDLGVMRGARSVLAGLSFDVTAGEALIVAGPNGAGKSTLLRSLAGLLPLCAGHITLSGVGAPDEDGDIDHARYVHYLGHKDGLKSALTAAENLNFWAAMMARDSSLGLFANKALTSTEALARMGLAHALDVPVAYLSAGQTRRVALARLLVAHRPIWLLDEPTTALDTASQLRVRDIMCAHLGEGGIVIAATHTELGLSSARELNLRPLTSGASS